jgi:hypothetical protein
MSDVNPGDARRERSGEQPETHPATAAMNRSLGGWGRPQTRTCVRARKSDPDHPVALTREPSARAEVAFRSRTAFVGARLSRLGSLRLASVQKARPAVGSAGRRKNAPNDRPSSGNRADSSAECSAACRLFVRESAMISQTLIAVGCHPRPSATGCESRDFRSSVPSISLISTNSVLSSMTSRCPVSACQASKSITPRSPQIEKETSAKTTHPEAAPTHAATALERRECRRLSNRWPSPPRHQPLTSSRTSRAPAIRRSVSTANVPSEPVSISEIVERATPAASARSRCRRPRLVRTARMRAPSC